MGMLLIPLFFLCAVVFALNTVFFFTRKSKGCMVSNLSYFYGIAFCILSYIVFYFIAANSWNGIKMIENTYLFYLTILLIPGTMGIMGVFMPKRLKVLNTIGFALSFSSIVASLLSIPYLFSV